MRETAPQLSVRSLDVLPETVANKLGVSSKAIFVSAPKGMTSEVVFIEDEGFEGYGGNTVVDTELARWFTDLYEFF
jgi:hypothetical protein